MNGAIQTASLSHFLHFPEFKKDRLCNKGIPAKPQESETTGNYLVKLGYMEMEKYLGVIIIDLSFVDLSHYLVADLPKCIVTCESQYINSNPVIYIGEHFSVAFLKMLKIHLEKILDY